MNAFACDQSPVRAARALADKHVVKMTLESTQVLSTVAHLKGLDIPGLYRVTHSHHPVVVRCLEHDDYLRWVCYHGLTLSEEYTSRYGKIHKSNALLEKLVFIFAGNGLPGSLDNAPVCTDDDLKGLPIVTAYRVYLARKYRAWGAEARWTRRERPEWLRYLDDES